MLIKSYTEAKLRKKKSHKVINGIIYKSSKQ